MNQENNKDITENITIEEALEELNQVMEELEDGKKTLEESFTLYEKGVKLVKYCSEKIDAVEKKLIVLKEEGEENEL